MYVRENPKGLLYICKIKYYVCEYIIKIIFNNKEYKQVIL